MTKWFYRDPLAAAWMAKQFGMRFTGDHNDHWRNVDLRYSENATFIFGPIEETASAHYETEFLGKQYYVHPDSLPLLEPRPGDLVKVMGNVGYLPRGEGFAERYALRVAQANCQPHATGQIIQRDGKPFHWPESE